mgnify:CR=1
MKEHIEGGDHMLGRWECVLTPMDTDRPCQVQSTMPSSTVSLDQVEQNYIRISNVRNVVV